MKQGVKLSIEERLEILKGVVETHAEGVFPMHEILKSVGITEATFASWMRIEDDRIKDVKDLYKKNQRDFTKNQLQNMIPRVVTNLQKLADGFTFEEEEVVYISDKEGKPQIKSKRVTKKTVAPNLGANIFIAKNASPDLFKDAYDHEISHKIPQGIDFNKLSPEQREFLESLSTEIDE